MRQKKEQSKRKATYVYANMDHNKIPNRGLWSPKGPIDNKIPGGPLNNNDRNKFPGQGL